VQKLSTFFSTYSLFDIVTNGMYVGASRVNKNTLKTLGLCFVFGFFNVTLRQSLKIGFIFNNKLKGSCVL
jgi:hypothetical protein